MDDSKLKKIEAELKKARMKRDEWDRKVKDLERKYREAENTCIHDMVHAATGRADPECPSGSACGRSHDNNPSERGG